MGIRKWHSWLDFWAKGKYKFRTSKEPFFTVWTELAETRMDSLVEKESIPWVIGAFPFSFS